MIEQIPVDAHVTHELGHVSALPVEDHLSGGVINTDDRRAHLNAGSHRLPGTCVDVFMGARSRPQRRGARVRAEDVDGVMHVRRVPPHKLRRALQRAKQTRGALDVAVRRTASGGPKGGEGGVQGPEQWVGRPGSDKHLPVINEPFITDALGPRGGWR